MATAQPGAALLEAVRVLQASVRELKGEAERPAPHADSSVGNLRAVIEALGRTGKPRAVRCPPEYEKEWEEVLSGDRDSLQPRAVRYLCWSPGVATDRSFQYFLDRFHTTLNARSLQGIVACCHARWSDEFANGQVVAKVLGRLNHYSGPNRVLQKWKSHPNTVLGPRAHHEFGRELIKEGISIERHCACWGIADEPSSFLQMAVEDAGVLCLEGPNRVGVMEELLFREILPWAGWSPDRLKHMVSRLILEAPLRKPELAGPITRLVMGDRRLGDPRLRQNQNNWLGIDDAARRVKEWLSAEDIAFFFEHVLPEKKDPHGRKAFWLRYVGCRGLVSRPLLNQLDRYRLRDILWRKGHEVSHFGEIEGNTSAFLLDFGPLLVVEFSAVGNACYIYEKRAGPEIVADFWTAAPFRVTDLKREGKAVARIIHRKRRFSWGHDGWEDEVERVLARFGIRALS